MKRLDAPYTEENKMTRSTPAWLAAALLAAVPAFAQQPAPPEFAPSNLTPSGVRALAANCAACHGTNGKAASGSSVPGLAGQPKEAFVTAMTQFKEGKRPATLMHQIAKGYTDAEINAMSDYFSKLPR